MGTFGEHLRRVFLGDRPVASTDAASDAEANANAANDNVLDPQLIAVLAAAATAALGRRVVVRRVTFINRNTISGWAEAGRTSIQLSHNLRRTI
jgi:hypothetical protein